MSGRYLLDTNIIIALFAEEALVKTNLGQASTVFIPSIALGELYYGARKSGRTQANLSLIDELVAIRSILVYHADAAAQSVILLPIVDAVQPSSVLSQTYPSLIQRR